MENNRLFTLLKTLTEIPGPVGREMLVQEFMEKRFQQYTDTVSYDGVGNLVAHFPGTGKKTAIAAHACEIGFMVKSISENGLINIIPNYKTRKADTRILPFHDVTIFTDTYESVGGVLTIDTGHVVDSDARDKVPALEDVYVDIGAISRSEVQDMGIHTGCPVTWDVKTQPLGVHVKGKAMDDRLGLVTLLVIAERICDLHGERDLYLASTVQEEIGVRGAHAFASHQEIDEAYILEIIPTSRNSMPLRLGEGPVIVYKDNALHYHHTLIMKCNQCARTHDIPLQTGILERGITDGLGFFVNAAAQSVLLGCPTLYPHSPGETIHLSDLQHLIELLIHMLRE
jgi:endoglucanase